MKYLSILAATIAATTYAGEVADSIHVSNYGAVPYSYNNAVQAVQQAINACHDHTGNVVLKFAPGRYDIWPEGATRREYFISNTSSEDECKSKVKTIGLLFDGLKNVTIDGDGAVLMMHGKITPIAFDNCENITLSGITVDFERPGGSELTYTDVQPGSVTVQAHRDTRYDIVNKRLQLIGEGWRSNLVHCIKYIPNSDRFVYSNDWQTLAKSDVTELSNGTLRFATPTDFTPEVGTTLTLRDIIRDQVGMFIYESKNVTLSHVNVKYMHGLGIVSQYSHNVSMHNVSCTPREGRLLTSSADFMHFSGCSGVIDIDSCTYIGAQDDAINVHGTNLRGVAKIDNNTLRLRFMHPQSYGYDAFWVGDTIAFVQAATMLRRENAVVTNVARISDREISVSFNKNIPADFEINHDCVENITRTPAVNIRNCFFNRINTRGILVTTPRKVLIENNNFLNVGMSAILIEADAEGWYESGPVKDVTITGNKFVGCGYNGGPQKATIAINPSNKIADKKKPVHSGITITNNHFDTDQRPVLYAKSTRGITFTNNTLTNVPNNAIILDACSNVKVKNK
jgi:hypothetical protein